jgi:hypothetical protein
MENDAVPCGIVSATLSVSLTSNCTVAMEEMKDPQKHVLCIEKIREIISC